MSDYIAAHSRVSIGNSTSTALAAGATFTGVAEEVDEFATVTVQAFSDVSSAPLGMSVQFSTDGTKINGGFFSTSLPPTLAIPNALRLGSKIDGTRDEIVLVVTPITNNITVDTALTWRELS